MSDYIVCPHKRNAPRVNVLVCRERCPLNKECEAYGQHLSFSLTENPLAGSVQELSSAASECGSA